MKQEEREQALASLKATVEKPGGKQALRFILNVLGCIPYAGGTFSGASALWGEYEQNNINKLFLNWASVTDSDIQKLFELFSQLKSEPTLASLALLIGEIFGDTIATELLTKNRKEIAVILNSTTVAELEPYIANEWISLCPTKSVCLMGAKNRVGNHFEELKRPYGLGNGFILTIVNI
ncbi:MAG: hypothetical protein ABH873_01205 [Candidatus Firestonebacteria bacterium]